MQRADSEVWSSREVARLLSLLENERRYFQEMVGLLPAGVAVLNSELQLKSTNRAFRQIFGLRPEAVAETGLAELPVHAIAPAAREILANGGRRSAFNPAVNTPGGTRPLRIHITRFRDWEEGNGDELLLVVEDLTGPVEKVRSELQASGAHLREQLSKAPALLWEADLEKGRFESVNTEALPGLGLEADAWMPGADIWGARMRESDRSPVKAIYTSAAARTSGTDYFSCDYRSQGAAGELRWLRDFVRIAGHRATGITVDVTAARARDEAALRSAKVDALTRLSGRVVHDCNNLLMITSGHGEELLHGLAPDDPLRGNAQQILTASDRLAVMTRSLSDYVKHPSPEQQHFSIDAIVSEMHKELRAALPERIELTIRPGMPSVIVEADPGLVVHTVRTMVQRAADSLSGTGRVSIETGPFENAAATAAAPLGLAPGSYAKLIVRDSGHAIHPDILDHLFEPQIGTDLEKYGLSTLYKSIREMGGDIQAVSEFGKGSVFTILLPATRTEKAVEPPPPLPEPVPETRVETVLIVEDEAGIRTLMRRILDREGYQLLEAAHGKAALEVARNHPGPIDLLVTDVVMPEMSGFELAREMHSFREGLKVLFISGYTGLSGVDPEQMKEGSAFLQKPFTLNAFVAKVRELLEKEQPAK
jgi:signal transduction histidine kinase/ActR/RegA family two-component response regulator